MNTSQEIKDFINLPKGWCYGSGVKISQETIDLVSDMNEYAENYGLVTEAFPGVDGEILLSVYGWEENNLEITVYFSDIDYYLEQNDEVVESDEFVSVEDVYELITDLAKVDA